MKAPTFSRICAHSGSSLGSNTTHFGPRNRLSSMNSAMRRTGMYFHSEPIWSLPWRVRAPQTTVPYTLKLRMQLTRVGIEDAIFLVGQRHRHSIHARQTGLGAGRRLPHSAIAVRPRVDTGHKTTWWEIVREIALRRVGRVDIRKIISRIDAGPRR